MNRQMFLNFTFAAIATLALSAGVGANDARAEMSKAEKIYAALAKLPADARAKRIEQGAKAEGKVVILGTGGSRGRKLSKMFKKQFPYLKAEISRMGSQQKVERFIAEERAGRHLTDALSVAVPVLGLPAQLDLLARYETPLAAKIGPSFKGLRDPQNRWTPWYQSEHGMGYNTKMIKAADAPKKWMDLCNPKYRGKVSFEPGETRFLLGLHAAFGMAKTEKFLKCLGQNKPILQRGHSNRFFLMMEGDHAILGDDLLWRGARGLKRAPDKTPYKAVWTAEVFADAIAGVISRNAPHPYAAALFVDWLLSDKVQKYIVKSGRAGVTIPHPFIPAHAKVITFGFADRATVDKLHAMWGKYVGRKKKKK
ncbi:MAG: extracellular solute-binding protein [Alphaproteobacteria bacterium]|nr:MAG: extracellular solute-binding protein [Alphaproteobacteria bacterium]